MLKFYLTTVIIYMIIIYSIISIFKDVLRKRFAINETKKTSLFKKLNNFFVISAVPILRFIFVIVSIYVAICKQEDFDELMIKTNK